MSTGQGVAGWGEVRSGVFFRGGGAGGWGTIGIRYRQFDKVVHDIRG